MRGMNNITLIMTEHHILYPHDWLHMLKGGRASIALNQSPTQGSQYVNEGKP